MAKRQGQNWTCPHCDRPQTLTEGQSSANSHYIYLTDHKYGEVGISVWAFACANPECRDITVDAALTNGTGRFNSYEPKTILQEYCLRPESHAKPQPDYIPNAIVQDYNEACRIRDLSPKASATLARRCLQGMIRDFCKIIEGRLIDEINKLKSLVDAETAPRGVTPESVEAIDHVRKIGNIGAHMEHDVNLIVEIDPEEAQALIELIEMLFKEWYVESHNRKLRLERIALIRADKDEAKKMANNKLAE